HPSSSARSLAGNRSYLMGLLYDNPSASYITKIQNGVLRTCRAQHYDLLIHPCDYKNPELEKEIREHVRNSRLDGIILTPPLTDSPSLLAFLNQQNTQYVLISPSSNSKFTWAVGTNDKAICRDMVRYLCGLGHERIGFILGHPDHSALANRFAGYQQGMQECGLPLRKRLCVQGFNTFESGADCARKLLSREQPPTAIFACNDDMAAGAIKAAYELGISVPEQLSVAGFDDIPLARQIWPSLTTVRQPMQGMGELAANLLIRRLRGQSPEEVDRVIPSELIVRDSTGPAPGRD
ncbi:MAG: substrate-binding domain-containing protein, partial [Xanthomonadales bacterium]|nr:substrate-binding domain-containing protein [Xanthomonadales bacterium]